MKLYVRDEGATRARYRVASQEEVLAQVRAAHLPRLLRGQAVEGQVAAHAAVRDLLVDGMNADRELFAVLLLDVRHRPLAFEVLFTGTLDSAQVHPREVVKLALHHNAAAIVLAHNHPSGMTSPSLADKRLTELLRDALALVGVRVLDHLIVAGPELYSFAQSGLL